MKIKPEHLEYMRAAFERKQMAPQYAHRSFPELGECIKAGMSAKRWRWDVATFVGLTPWLCEHVYPYANDDHIDTAMRVITGTK